jgi:dynein heavy chain, axonemal
MTAKTFNFRK